MNTSIFGLVSRGDGIVSGMEQKMEAGFELQTNAGIDYGEHEVFIFPKDAQDRSVVMFQNGKIPIITYSTIYFEVHFGDEVGGEDEEDMDDDEPDDEIFGFSIGFATKKGMCKNDVDVGKTNLSFGLHIEDSTKAQIIMAGKIVKKIDLKALKKRNRGKGVRSVGVGWNKFSHEIFFIINKERISFKGCDVYNKTHPFFIYKKYTQNLLPTITICPWKDEEVINNKSNISRGVHFCVITNKTMFRNNPKTVIFHEETPTPILSTKPPKKRLFCYKGFDFTRPEREIMKGTMDEAHMAEIKTIKFKYKKNVCPIMQFYPFAKYDVKEDFAYFELLVMSYEPNEKKKKPAQLSIGVAPLKFDGGKVGNLKCTYGYDALNGEIRHNGEKKLQFEKWRTSDVVGVGFNFKSFQLFFTCNGKMSQRTFHLDKEILSELCLTVTATHNEGTTFMPILEKERLMFKDFEKVEAVKSDKWRLTKIFE